MSHPLKERGHLARKSTPQTPSRKATRATQPIKIFTILILSLCTIFLPLTSLSLHAQPDGIEQKSSLVFNSGTPFLRWQGEIGRTYFVLVSDSNDHLAKWTWAPIIEAGHGAPIEHEMFSNPRKAFFRLAYTSQLIPPGKTIETADFDDDGLTNLQEITAYFPTYTSDSPSGIQTSPLNPDTDGDGISDKNERDYGSDPTNNPSNNPPPLPPPATDTDEDGLTNDEEIALGTDPLKADSDDDLLPDKWETAHDLNPLSLTDEQRSNDRVGDPDIDQTTNYDEFLGGTDPLDPLAFPPAMARLNRNIAQYLIVYPPPVDPEDNQSEPEGFVSAFASGFYWNNLPTNVYEETTNPLSASQLGPYLASKVAFSTEAPDAEFGSIVANPIWLAQTGGSYTKSGPANGFTMRNYLVQSQCWLKISPKQKSTAAQKISYLKVSKYVVNKGSYTPAKTYPPDLQDAPWTPYDIAVVEFEFEPGATVSKPLEIDQQLIGSGEDTDISSVTTLGLVTVEWNALPGFHNLSDHTDPGNSNDISGKRIFPDYKDPNDTEVRHKLEIIVKTAVSLKGQKVFVKAFDVDDSTSATIDVAENGSPAHIIDSNHKQETIICPTT